MCVGRLTEQKGFDVAIRAFVRVRDERPEVRLVIVGDGEERPQLQQLAAELGVDQDIEFTGLIPPDRVPAKLEEATIVLMPSRWEGLPVVGVQVAMAGRPIVGADIRGMREAVISGRTGILVEGDNSDELAAATLRLLGDPMTATALGEAARTHSLEHFVADRMFDRYEELYRSLSGVADASTGNSS